MKEPRIEELGAKAAQLLEKTQFQKSDETDSKMMKPAVIYFH